MDLFIKTKVELSPGVLDCVLGDGNAHEKCNQLEVDLQTICPEISLKFTEQLNLELCGAWEDIVKVQGVLKQRMVNHENSKIKESAPSEVVKTPHQVSAQNERAPAREPAGVVPREADCNEKTVKTSKKPRKEKVIEQQVYTRPKRNIKHKILPLLKTKGSHFCLDSSSSEDEFHKVDVKRVKVEPVTVPEVLDKTNIMVKQEQEMPDSITQTLHFSDDVPEIQDSQTQTLNSSDNIINESYVSNTITPLDGVTTTENDALTGTHFTPETVETEQPENEAFEMTTPIKEISTSEITLSEPIPECETNLDGPSEITAALIGTEITSQELFIADADAQEAFLQSADVGDTAHMPASSTAVAIGRSDKRVTDVILYEANSYGCRQCKYSTTTMTNIKLHILRSHLPRPFKCDECDKSYGLLKDLTTHKSVHTKPFPCGHCQMSFAKQYKLSNHVRNMHDQIPKKKKVPTATLR